MTRDNKRYTKEEKESLVRRMLPPENISTSLLSIETGISKSTLATCKSKATGGAASKSKRSMGTRDKFMIVMETYTLSEIYLSKYCREHGLYDEEVKQWRSSCIGANDVVRNNNNNL